METPFLFFMVYSTFGYFYSVLSGRPSVAFVLEPAKLTPSQLQAWLFVYCSGFALSIGLGGVFASISVYGWLTYLRTDLSLFSAHLLVLPVVFGSFTAWVYAIAANKVRRNLVLLLSQLPLVIGVDLFIAESQITVSVALVLSFGLMCFPFLSTGVIPGWLVLTRFKTYGGNHNQKDPNMLKRFYEEF